MSDKSLHEEPQSGSSDWITHITKNLRLKLKKSEGPWIVSHKQPDGCFVSFHESKDSAMKEVEEELNIAYKESKAVSQEGRIAEATKLVTLLNAQSKVRELFSKKEEH